MSGMPVEKHGSNADLRQKGKNSALACGNGGTEAPKVGMLCEGVERSTKPSNDHHRGRGPSLCHKLAYHRENLRGIDRDERRKGKWAHKNTRATDRWTRYRVVALETVPLTDSLGLIWR